MWWKKDEGEPFCRYLSDAKNRVPCQKHQCEQYVPIPEHPEGKHVCIDRLDSMFRHDSNILANASFKDGERVMKFFRGMAKAVLTGKVDDEFLKVAQLEKKEVKILGHSDKA